jgi:hypothetical protein
MRNLSRCRRCGAHAVLRADGILRALRCGDHQHLPALPRSAAVGDKLTD